MCDLVPDVHDKTINRPEDAFEVPPLLTDLLFLTSSTFFAGMVCDRKEGPTVFVHLEQP